MGKKKNKQEVKNYGDRTGIMFSGHGAATANPDTVRVTAEGIENILLTAFETHTEQETIRKALDILAESAGATAPGVTNSSITGCSVVGP